MPNKKTIISYNQEMERQYKRIRQHIEALGSKAWQGEDITITTIKTTNSGNKQNKYFLISWKEVN
jgi:hypothetical protein